MLTSLIDASVDLLKRSRSLEAQWYVNRLASVSGRVVVTQPNSIPLNDGFPSFNSHDVVAATAVLEAIEAVAAELTCFQSSTLRVPPGWAHQAAAVECVGPGGMIIESDFRFGVFVLEQATHYPMHWHAANELYFVVSGQAEFTLESTDGVVLTAGGYFETPSLVLHSIRTHDQPVLMWWGWRGDISFERYGF